MPVGVKPCGGESDGRGGAGPDVFVQPYSEYSVIIYLVSAPHQGLW